MTQKSVNRHLNDDAMDNIDHALGRPINPMKLSHRNYFETASHEETDDFLATGHWEFTGALCVVNDAGREALNKHLTEGRITNGSHKL